MMMTTIPVMMMMITPAQDSDISDKDDETMEPAQVKEVDQDNNAPTQIP